VGNCLLYVRGVFVVKNVNKTSVLAGIAILFSFFAKTLSVLA
jgi:hypothetical protein